MENTTLGTQASGNYSTIREEVIIQIMSELYQVKRNEVKSQIWGLSNYGRLFFLQNYDAGCHRWVLRTEGLKEDKR